MQSCVGVCVCVCVWGGGGCYGYENTDVKKYYCVHRRHLVACRCGVIAREDLPNDARNNYNMARLVRVFVQLAACYRRIYKPRTVRYVTTILDKNLTDSWRERERERERERQTDRERQR